METKEYDLGVVCGRFGHEHLGHVSLFDTCISKCNRILILVGSAQEHGTLRNPFKVETRIDVIKKTYPNETEKTLTIRGINDLTHEYDVDCHWGKYVKSEVERHMNKFADLIVYGNDELRSKWFAPEDLVGTSELIIKRELLKISATELRGMLVINDKDNWKKSTHPLIHEMYDRLREELMCVPIYKEIYNQIHNDISLDSFSKIYKELEKKDKENKLLRIK